MAITHAKVSAKPDGSDSSLVLPSDWNAAHVGGVQASLLDAKGDLIVASANDTPGRLAVGSNNQVLTADSAQTLGVKWATPSAAGSVATDAIFDAKGDLPVGTGADTAAKLTVGSNGQILTADSGETTGLKWAAAAGGGPTTVKKTADETVTGSTALQDDDHLFFAVAANTVYYFEVSVIMTCTGGGVKMGWSVPSGGAMSWGAGHPEDTLNSNLSESQTLADASSPVSAIRMHTFFGIVTIGGSSGTVQFRWAQNSASGATTLTKGCRLAYERTDA